MVEQEADEAFEIHMEDTWNNMNQVAWETLRDLLPKIAELENEQNKKIQSLIEYAEILKEDHKEAMAELEAKIRNEQTKRSV